MNALSSGYDVQEDGGILDIDSFNASCSSQKTSLYSRLQYGPSIQSHKLCLFLFVNTDDATASQIPLFFVVNSVCMGALMILLGLYMMPSQVFVKIKS